MRQAGFLALQRDQGGSWRLSAELDVYKLAGQRARPEGVRIGFDVLDVKRIAPLAG